MRKKRSDDFGTFVGGAIDYAWEFIRLTDELRFWGKFVAEWSPEDERARTLLPQRSADAAEFAAKALCLAAGSDYAKVHDLNALAEAVPEHLRERVRGLNGHSRNDHMAGLSRWVVQSARSVTSASSMPCACSPTWPGGKRPCFPSERARCRCA